MSLPLALLSVLSLPLPAPLMALNTPLQQKSNTFKYVNGDFFLSRGQTDNSFLNWNCQKCSWYLEWSVSDRIGLDVVVRSSPAEPYSVTDTSVNKVVFEIPHNWKTILESPKYLHMILAFEEEVRPVMENLSVCPDVAGTSVITTQAMITLLSCPRRVPGWRLTAWLIRSLRRRDACCPAFPLQFSYSFSKAQLVFYCFSCFLFFNNWNFTRMFYQPA